MMIWYIIGRIVVAKVVLAKRGYQGNTMVDGCMYVFMPCKVVRVVNERSLHQ